MRKLDWIISLAGVVLVGVIIVLLVHKGDKQTKVAPAIATPVEQPTNETKPLLAGIYKPYSQFTSQEKVELEKVFSEYLKPAIDRWANAYSNRVPFDVSDVTLDKFHSRGDGGFYTFMIGSTTFTVLHNRKYTKVFYLMTKQGAHDLNSIPRDAGPVDLSVPITREEALKMAEADTGLHYELKDIVIRPTGAFCVIDGGANVEVGIKYENGGMIVRPDNLSFTIGKDGKLITYQH